MPADILLVDDSTMLRMLVSYSLTGSDGFSVTEAGGAAEALAALDAADFSMMLTDFHMPGMDGVDLVREVRAMPRHAAMPIIMLTSDRDPVVEQAAAEAGVDAFLRKPFEPRELHEAVREMLEMSMAAEASARPARFGAQTLLDAFPYPAMLVDEDHLVVMGNPAFYSLTRTGVSDTGVRCADVMHANGRAPLDCPLADAMATGEAVERVIRDLVLGPLKVEVYPMDPGIGRGRRLYMHLARPTD